MKLQSRITRAALFWSLTNFYSNLYVQFLQKTQQKSKEGEYKHYKSVNDCQLRDIIWFVINYVLHFLNTVSMWSLHGNERSMWREKIEEELSILSRFTGVTHCVQFTMDTVNTYFLNYMVKRFHGHTILFISSFQVCVEENNVYCLIKCRCVTSPYIGTYVVYNTPHHT